MKNAYEWRAEYTPSGRCIKREVTVGPIVIWGAVVLAGLIMGRAFTSVPPGLWDFFRR